MNKTFFLFTLCVFGLLSVCGQTNKQLVRAQGYFTVPTRGTIAVDDNGRPLDPGRDSVFVLIVETKSNAIKWERAWKDGRSFSLLVSKISGKETLGRSRAGENIEMAPGKGNTLWKIELADDAQKRKAPERMAHHDILVQAKSGNKSFFISIKSITELASPEYQ